MQLLLECCSTSVGILSLTLPLLFINVLDILSVPLAIHCSLVLAVAALILAILAYTRTGQDKKEK